MIQTVEQQWKEYSTRIWKGMKEISRAQHDETLQAFYAGAFSMLMNLKQINDEMSDEEGIQILVNYTTELETFHRDFIKQRLNRN